MAAAAASPQPLDLLAVLSESKRIINAHSRHFLALSVLFLLPLSFSLSVYPSLQTLLLSGPDPDLSPSLLRHLSPQQPQSTTKSLALAVAFSAFASILALCAACSITFSVLHGFYGRPVKLISAIQSIFTSFFPLLITTVVTQIIVTLICGVFLLYSFLVVKGIEFFGLQVNYSSPYFIAFGIIVLIALQLVLMYLQVNWTLVSVVVVAESGWGIQPLRRSKNLIKGMRRVALSLFIFFAFSAGVLVWGSSVSPVGFGGGHSWLFVVQIVVTSALLVAVFLYNAAANTVLYMYCKAVHGELAGEIAEEFAREYVSLPFDDEKIPHVVSVVYD